MGLLGDLLAENLKKLRKSRGFTQETLAAAANLSPSGIQGIEYQNRWPSDATLERVATALEVPVAALFSDKDLIVKPTVEQALEVLSAFVLETSALRSVPGDILADLSQANETDLASIRDILEAGKSLRDDTKRNPRVRAKKNAG
jgi:transcriptional regulator with XRE-family HTH domain